MGIPLRDISRRPTHRPVITVSIIAINLVVFVLELAGGEPFVRQWSVVPAEIAAGQHWVTILTAMFMHGGWMHIIGNMVFLWAFGPEIEDAMGPLRYLAFYLLGGFVAFLAQIAAASSSTIPNLGASGAIADPAIEQHALRAIGNDLRDPVRERELRDERRILEMRLVPLVALAHVDQRRASALELGTRVRGRDLLDPLLGCRYWVPSGRLHPKSS